MYYTMKIDYETNYLKKKNLTSKTRKVQKTIVTFDKVLHKQTKCAVHNQETDFSLL